MFKWIVKKFIKNYKNVKEVKVQEQYGVLCSIVSILCNGWMVAFKLIVGVIVNSTAIIADALNNLSDMGSNLATLFGFKLANKHPDSDHPYGHGRIEYIVGMMISFLIFYVGIRSLSESFHKIIHPTAVTFQMSAVIILCVSIGLKLWMASFNKYTGKIIQSVSLEAAGQDSLNDVLVTSASLFSLVFAKFSTLPIDGWIGMGVSLLVIKSGAEIFKSTMDPLLGQSPDKELIQEIEEYVMSYDVVLGIHDLMMHDYGPSRRYMTLHTEVNSNGNIIDIHDQIDLIERNILKKYQIFTTIHMDPIDADDKKTKHLKWIVENVIHDIDDRYTIHDFRIVSGTTHTNLIFDVVIPSDVTKDHAEVKQEIVHRIRKINPEYCPVIEVEHAYV